MRKKDLIGWSYGLPFAALLLGGVLALLGAQMILVKQDRERLDEYASGLLDRAREVAMVSADLLALVQHSGNVPCSKDDIAELRVLAFQSRLLRDVGRVRDGRIICTAGWGDLVPPVTLPPYRLETARGVRLWTSVGNIVDPRIVADMAGQGDVIVFTSPNAFELFEHPPAGIGALVTNSDSGYVFQRFGDVRHLEGGKEQYSMLGRSQTLYQCSPPGGVDVCVTAGYHEINILKRPLPLLAGVAGLGGLAGVGLGLALASWRRERHSLAMQLRRALLHGDLHIHYQPLVCLRDRRMVGAEALARWEDDEGEGVSPEDFIPMAEHMGLMSSLTRQIVRKALDGVRERLVDDSGFYISINLTASNIADAEFHLFLQKELASRGISPCRVVLEITERSTAKHCHLIEGIEALRALGYRIYVDDFGTGYSSLSYLADLPIDAIKVDKMFTRAIGSGSATERIVEQICAMVGPLGIGLVVEGIETEQQAAYVQAIVPEVIGQGWLFGHPVAADRLGETEVTGENTCGTSASDAPEGRDC
ncbi:EAL domain-containing protein [Stutzerimonas kirkiae]|uniref:cyclic-guanylate-specific phosphodiesterase n=1 Tax=Stutzerimonas kirkiae TaxID=2211392 RepID=A0A4Q9R178_9GAMM|nr:EAL domain-containing protein [Stutzerimonas kirkiae]TBU92636.1 diguanylate phosphodiesterase [Stutzerimonas kirkiae]TBV00828.1 diguanylate phosphodiesterase [Stutzerimonas kirkiae]TBV08719.1 diguanylate phosphodiesterase [Stutzerimonas kirkiae]